MTPVAVMFLTSSASAVATPATTAPVVLIIGFPVRFSATVEIPALST